MSPLSESTFPVVGILGGGQLGRMTALAAIRMGLGVRFLVPQAAPPVEGLGETFVGDWTDPNLLRRFGKACTVVTTESEWAPAEAAEKALGDGVPVRPGSAVLELIRHKGRQKMHLRQSGLPVPDFVCCQALEEARRAADSLGYPVLVKRYTHSYDGYGNATVQSPSELPVAWSKLATEDGLLVERFVAFERELSVIVARRLGGEYVAYPVIHTEQRNHRCYAVEVPAPIDPAIGTEALRTGLAAVEAVDGTGVTAVELFLLHDGRILINELAPRPHNTGHFSIEGSYTSQFENHLRAILDLPLGSPESREPIAVMVNVLGGHTGVVRARGLKEALAVPGVSVHVYGKPDVRVHRKMGHVTATGPNREETRRRAERAASFLQW